MSANGLVEVGSIWALNRTIGQSFFKRAEQRYRVVLIFKRDKTRFVKLKRITDTHIRKGQIRIVKFFDFVKYYNYMAPPEKLDMKCLPKLPVCGDVLKLRGSIDADHYEVIDVINPGCADVVYELAHVITGHYCAVTHDQLLESWIYTTNQNIIEPGHILIKGDTRYMVVASDDFQMYIQNMSNNKVKTHSRSETLSKFINRGKAKSFRVLVNFVDPAGGSTTTHYTYHCSRPYVRDDLLIVYVADIKKIVKVVCMTETSNPNSPSHKIIGECNMDIIAEWEQLDVIKKVSRRDAIKRLKSRSNWDYLFATTVENLVRGNIMDYISTVNTDDLEREALLHYVGETINNPIDDLTLASIYTYKI